MREEPVATDPSPTDNHDGSWKHCRSPCLWIRSTSHPILVSSSWSQATTRLGLF